MTPLNAMPVGAGDTLLGGLPAGTTPNGPAPSAAMPFAQLLDGAMARAPDPGEGAPGAMPTLASAAIQPLPTQPIVALPCGMPRPATGKNLPAGLADGTTLPRPVPTLAQSLVARPQPAMPLPEEEGEQLVDEPTGELPPAELVQAAPQDVPAATVVPALAQPQPAAPVIVAAAAPLANPPAARAQDLPAARPTPAGASAATVRREAPAVTLVAADLPVAADRTVAAVMPPAIGQRAQPAAVFDPSAFAPVPEQAIATPSAPQVQVPLMQDLTQIVERLAVAREAAAPAATRLAVDHAEFGPLSLTIQQGGGGELAIEVAAADTGSQAALVAALAAADLPHFDNAPDRRDAAPEREDGPTSDGRGQSQGSDRFAGQSQQRSGQPPRGEPQQGGGHGEARSGTYA